MGGSVPMPQPAEPTPIHDPPRHGWRRIAIAWASVLLPLLMAWAVILPLRVDVPLWDDWERGPLLAKWHNGTLGFRDLYAPHIQHRLVVPRIVTLVSNAMTHGNLRDELAVNFAVIVLTALGAGLLAWRSLAPAGCAPFIAFLVSALLCSPIQYQNYLWVTTLGIAIPALCLVLAIFAWQSRFAVWIRFGLCLLLALIGTYSFGHGIVLWPAILLLLASGDEPPARRVRLCLLWTVIGAATAAAYFHDLHNTAHPTHAYFEQSEQATAHNLALLKTDPAKLGLFFVRLLGSPLCRAPYINLLDTALAIGFCILALLAGAAVIWFARFGDPGFRRRAAPWIVLGAYGVACAAAVTWGRGGWETSNRALTPRYITMAQHAAAAALVLIPLLVRRRTATAAAPALAPLGWALGGVFAGWMLLQWIQGARLASAWAWGRIQAKAQMVVLPITRPSTLKLIDSELSFVRTQMDFLSSKGFLNPPPLDSPWLDRFPEAKRPLAPDKGGIDPVGFESGNFVVSGTAFTPGSARPADAVLICDKSEGRWRIRQIADPELPQGERRFNVDFEFTSQHIGGGFKLLPRWEARIRADQASSPDGEWSAWILDGTKWRVTRIPGTILLGTPQAAAHPAPR